LDGGFATSGDFPDVIELDPRARFTPMPGVAHERALASVSLPYRALHLVGDVPRARGRVLPALSRPRRRCEPAPLDLRDQCLERAAKDLPDATAAGAWPQQAPDVAEIVVHLLVHREVGLVRVCRQRRHPLAAPSMPRGMLDSCACCLRSRVRMP